MHYGVARQFDSALLEVTIAYRKFLEGGCRLELGSLGVSGRDGGDSLELGTYDGVDIYVRLSPSRSSLRAASNCNFPSTEMIGEYVEKIREFAAMIG